MNPEKTCTKCGEAKPLNDFYMDAKAPDGHYARCKACHKAMTAAYQKTPAGMAVQAAFRHSEAGAASQRRWRATDARRDSQRRYESRKASEEGRPEPRTLAEIRASWAQYIASEDYRMIARMKQKRAMEKFPDRFWARIDVGNAIKTGALVPWPVCAVPECSTTKPHAHHPDYSRPLDVVWLCVKHHREAHSAAIKSK